MSKQTAGLIAMAVGAILAVARPAAAQDPTSVDYHGDRYHFFMSGAARMTVAAALSAPFGACRTPIASICSRTSPIRTVGR